jgi:hypothetical protein
VANAPEKAGDQDLIGVTDRFGDAMRHAAFAAAYVIKQRRLDRPVSPQTLQTLDVVVGDLRVASDLIFSLRIDDAESCDLAKKRVSSAFDGLRQIMVTVGF